MISDDKGQWEWTRTSGDIAEIKSMASVVVCEEEDEEDLTTMLRFLAQEVEGYIGCRHKESEQIWGL